MAARESTHELPHFCLSISAAPSGPASLPERGWGEGGGEVGGRGMGGERGLIFPYSG